MRRVHPVPLALCAVVVAACSSAAPSIDPRRSTAEAVAPPSAATCDVGRPYFEFQVESPAVWLPDSASRVAGAIVPDGRARRELAVQFVVDTLGRPEPGTYKVLHAERQTFADSARQLVATWRWQPARLNGCRVRQLVQTNVTRR